MLFYNVGITFLGFLSVVATFHPVFDKPGYETIRASVYVGMAVFGMTCLPLALVIHGAERMWPVSSSRPLSNLSYTLLYSSSGEHWPWACAI